MSNGSKSCCWKWPELYFQINQIAFWSSSPIHVPWWLLHWRGIICHGNRKSYQGNCKQISLNSLHVVLNIHILSNIKVIKQSYFHQVSYTQIKIIANKKNNIERKAPQNVGEPRGVFNQTSNVQEHNRKFSFCCFIPLPKWLRGIQLLSPEQWSGDSIDKNFKRSYVCNFPLIIFKRVPLKPSNLIQM